MTLKNKLKNQSHDVIWNYYCGFLDLSMDQYMAIQNRLMLEQIGLWSGSELGKSILKGKKPNSIDEFRGSATKRIGASAEFTTPYQYAFY